MKHHGDSEFLSRCDESAQILEDWINRKTSEDHSQLNKLYSDRNKKVKIPNLGDHRICMSSTILSLITGIKTKINNFETVKTSSPNFLRTIKSLGAKFEVAK